MKSRRFKNSGKYFCCPAEQHDTQVKGQKPGTSTEQTKAAAAAAKHTADMFSVSPPRNTLLLAVLSLVLSRCSYSSLSVPDIPHIAPYFGTKTRYEEVNPHLLRDVFSVNKSVLKAPASERCSPVHLTAVIRHGSRYPTVKNIRRIQKLSELVRREASRGSEGWQQDIQSRWENWFTEDMDGEFREPSN